MEIDKNLPNQSNDISFKNEDVNQAQPNVTLLEQKIKNSNNNENINDDLQDSQKSDSSKIKRNSYQIILRTSYDKIKTSSEKHKSDIDINQINTNANEKENACSQNENSLNVNESSKFNDNDKQDNIQTNEDIGNKVNNNMEVEDENNNNMNDLDNKDQNKNENMHENNEENNNSDKYYNAFNKDNKKGYKSPTKENIKLGYEENKYNNKKGKLLNITLTTFQPPIINNEEKEGHFSRFLKLFSTHKKEKKIEKSQEEKDEEGMKNNELMTLEEKLKDESHACDKSEKENNENDTIYKKDDYIINVKSPKKEELEKDDLKKEDNTEEQEKEENDKELNNNLNNYNFIIKAEPIFGNNNKEDMNNNLNTENKICDSEEMKDDDKSSKYSYLSSKSIIELIRKNSKCSVLLLAILFGSCGLFYLLYKKMNLKELLAKISEFSKLIPGFFSNIFSAILEDFMERYNDVYRLLIGIIIIIGLWFLIKIHFKAFMKRKKNN